MSRGKQTYIHVGHTTYPSNSLEDVSAEPVAATALGDSPCVQRSIQKQAQVDLGCSASLPIHS